MSLSTPESFCKIADTGNVGENTSHHSSFEVCPANISDRDTTNRSGTPSSSSNPLPSCPPASPPLATEQRNELELSQSNPNATLRSPRPHLYKRTKPNSTQFQSHTPSTTNPTDTKDADLSTVTRNLSFSSAFPTNSPPTLSEAPAHAVAQPRSETPFITPNAVAARALSFPNDEIDDGFAATNATTSMSPKPVVGKEMPIYVRLSQKPQNKLTDDRSAQMSPVDPMDTTNLSISPTEDGTLSPPLQPVESTSSSNTDAETTATYSSHTHSTLDTAPSSQRPLVFDTVTSPASVSIPSSASAFAPSTSAIVASQPQQLAQRTMSKLIAASATSPVTAAICYQMSSQVSLNQSFAGSQMNDSHDIVRSDPGIDVFGISNSGISASEVDAGTCPRNTASCSRLDTSNALSSSSSSLTSLNATSTTSDVTLGTATSTTEERSVTQRTSQEASHSHQNDSKSGMGRSMAIGNPGSFHGDAPIQSLPPAYIRSGDYLYIRIQKSTYFRTPSANPLCDPSSDDGSESNMSDDSDMTLQVDILERSPFAAVGALPLWMTCNCAYPYGYPTERRLAVDYCISALSVNKAKKEKMENLNSAVAALNDVGDDPRLGTAALQSSQLQLSDTGETSDTDTSETDVDETDAIAASTPSPSQRSTSTSTVAKEETTDNVSELGTANVNNRAKNAHDEDVNPSERADFDDIHRFPTLPPIPIAGKMSFGAEITDVYISDLFSSEAANDEFRSLSQLAQVTQASGKKNNTNKTSGRDYPHSAKVCQCGIWGPRNQHDLDAICNIDTELWAHNSDVYVFVPEASPFDDEFGLVITSTTARARNMRGKMMCRGFGSMALRTLFMERSRKMRKLAKETRKRKRNSEYDDDDDLVLPSDSRSASSPISSANTEVDMIYIRLHANTVSELKALDSLHSEQRHLLRALYHNHNVFLTGGAGTGKSHLIRTLTSKLPVRVQVTATTGMAAIGVGGITIHSLSKIELGYGVAKDIARKVCLLI